MRVACLLVTHLRAKVEMYRQPHLKDAPVVIVDRSPARTRPVVVDRFRSVPGVMTGMTLEQALSCHANTVVLDADEPHYRRVFGQVLASLQGISDRVEGSDLGTAYVRLDGLEGLFRIEAGVVSALLNTVPAYLTPQVGVADAKFPAFVAARTCGAHGAFRVPEDVVAFLAPHTIDLLPVSSDVKRGLHRFGLHTLGAVASMSGHMLADRAGREVGLVAMQRHRSQPRHPIGIRRISGRTDLTAVPLLFHADTLCRRGHSPQESVHPIGHEGQICWRGAPPLHGLRLDWLGKAFQLQGAGRRVGESLLRSPKQNGG